MNNHPIRDLRIGSRGSKLALIQSNHIKEAIEALDPQCRVSIQVIRTKGDAIQEVALDKIGDKGLFVKEIELALLAGEIDLAVHSMKDMPTDITEGLAFLPAIGRADARDVLVVRADLLEPSKALIDAREVLMHLPPGARIGTGAKRRSQQIKVLRDDLQIEGIRGNVDTRLRKLEAGDYDAVVLAKAGLDRLGLTPNLANAFVFKEGDLVPAPAQGILGLQTRVDDQDLASLLAPLVDLEAHYACLAERSFLEALGAGCHMPVGAYAQVDAGGMVLSGILGDTRGQALVRGTEHATFLDETSAESLGQRLADRLLKDLRDKRNQDIRSRYEPRVFLVGAGCGDTQLMTLKGKALLERCDAVVYDRLANPEFLDWVPQGTKKIYVGKAAGHHAMGQEDINKTLVRLGTTHDCVVRLKGGDPYVFGRGAEEGQALSEAGIPFEVVPGITSAIGGIGYAGIPVTHRDFAQSFHVITGHLREDQEDSDLIDFSKIAQYEGTLVFLMGLSSLGHIAEGLMRHGKGPKTPVALVSWASHPKQRMHVGTLEDIHSRQMKDPLPSPAIIVVGDVVSMHQDLAWFATRPLFGKTFVVTRARTQASRLRGDLENFGAQVIEVPAIRIEARKCPDFDRAIRDLKAFTYLGFTSQNGVNLFFERLTDLGLDTRALGHLKVVAVGKATGEALRAKGIRPDLVPKTYTGTDMGKMLIPHLNPRDHLMLIRGIGGDPGLVTALGNPCPITECYIYEAVGETLNKDQERQLMQADLSGITFTSGSTVRCFVEALGPEQAAKVLEKTPVYVIGPTTEKAFIDQAMSLGIPQFTLKVAKDHTLEGLVTKILQATLQIEDFSDDQT